MADTTLGSGIDAAADRVASLFARIQDALAGWRTAILAGAGETSGPAELDDRVGALVLPSLEEDDPLLVGAGFIAAPEFAGGSELHFSWWLGPLEDNPVLGATTGPTKLDLAARSYSDYLRDFRSLEWYRVPQSTHRTHITGPYVDHLCACDYIVTVTSPVERDERMIGVVGVDVYVKRLERELLPAMLRAGGPLALVNESGRVMVSTDPAVVVGTVLDAATAAVPCPGTPFLLVPTT
ncbi:cache domain-containing protein [Leifsonia sp. NPDC080035]|uniref:Cache domain-containing protein n=1 Tax=Leifsonia sp. NPDC080035 TaxID=3143936 RepID=A0AAU7GBH3_9MICO